MADLPDDTAQRVKENRAHLVPPVGSTPVGYALRVTGHSPPAFAWRQADNDNEIIVGNGDPNGVYSAPKGRLYVDRTVPMLWINNDGLDSWNQVGGGTLSFPFSYDDGTFTYELTAVGGELQFRVTENANPTNFAYFEVDDGYVNVVAYKGVTFANGAGGDDITIDSTNNVVIRSDANVEINAGTGLGPILIGASDSNLAFFGVTDVARPTVTGSRGGNAALASLLTELENLGLIVDGTSA